MIQVEVFTAPGCSKCGHAKQLLQALAEQMDGICWREVDILAEMDYAVRLGVLSTPALSIDGELVFTGLPSQKKLRQALEQRLGRQIG